MKPLSADPGKVAVLMGGASAEREISLMSGLGVLQAVTSKARKSALGGVSARDAITLRGTAPPTCTPSACTNSTGS